MVPARVTGNCVQLDTLTRHFAIVWILSIRVHATLCIRWRIEGIVRASLELMNTLVSKVEPRKLALVLALVLSSTAHADDAPDSVVYVRDIPEVHEYLLSSNPDKNGRTCHVSLKKQFIKDKVHREKLVSSLYSGTFMQTLLLPISYLSGQTGTPAGPYRAAQLLKALGDSPDLKSIPTSGACEVVLNLLSAVGKFPDPSRAPSVSQRSMKAAPVVNGSEAAGLVESGVGAAQ